jgi:hypothetical protein
MSGCKHYYHSPREETMNIKAIVNAFKLPKKYTQLQSTTDAESVERKIVSRLSRGNVSLRSGRYMTEDELSLRVSKVTQHKFS